MGLWPLLNFATFPTLLFIIKNGTWGYQVRCILWGWCRSKPLVRFNGPQYVSGAIPICSNWFAPPPKVRYVSPPGNTYTHSARNRAWRHCQAIVHACNKALHHCLAVVHVHNMTYIIVWPSSMWLKLPLGDISHKWFIDGTGGQYGKVSVQWPPVLGLVLVHPDPGQTKPEAYVEESCYQLFSSTITSHAYMWAYWYIRPLYYKHIALHMM